MTVAQDILKSGPYNTDGTTKAFAATFQYLEDSDIVVTLLNTTTGATTVGVLNTDYTVVDNVSPIIGGTVTIANNGFGGIANATGVIAAGYTITLNPAIPILQAESYPNGGLFPSAAVEQALDRLTLIAQGLQLATSESLKYPVTDSSTISNVLPNSTQRASLLLGFDALGNPIATAGTGSVTISVAMIPVVQSASTQIAAETLLNGNIASLTKAIIDTNVFEQWTANVNSYAQAIYQNTNNGATASTDIIINNNLGTSTTFFGNLGINSSGFTGSGSFNKASAVYLSSTSGDLVIGSTTANPIHFVYNGGTTDSAFIDSTGFNAVKMIQNGNPVITKVNVVKITSSGTYNPTTGMVSCAIECIGGGGGGGGVAGSGSGNGAAGGGGAGSPSITFATAATIGVSQTVTIGGGGNGGTAGNNGGSAGGDTSVGSICIGKGGSGGGGSGGGAGAGGGLGGVAGTGTITGTGQNGFSSGGGNTTVTASLSGAGGASRLGSGGLAQSSVSGVSAGAGATGFGSGGSGAAAYAIASTAAGGAGTAGIVIITEYISA